jgi:uncharacterized protein DUF7010
MTPDLSSRESDTGVRRRGVLILAGFAIVWAMAGSTGVTDATTGRFLFAGAVMLAGLVTLPVLRRGSLPATARPRRLPPDWQRRYNRVGLAEAVAIGAALAVCLGLGAPHALPVVICLIVGVHFLPLARIFDQPPYRATAVGLTLVAAVGAVATATGHPDPAVAVVGFGAFAVLFVTALHLAVRG